MKVQTTLFIYSKRFTVKEMLIKIHQYYVYGILDEETLNYTSTTLLAKISDLRALINTIEITSTHTTQFLLRDMKNIFSDDITILRLESLQNETLNLFQYENKNKS